jgi:ABC-type glycerol-3-phosphate transport system substrate-binding protein
MIEKTPMVTKFVDGHPCLGGTVYDSDNMPFIASVGKTKIKKDKLETVADKYPEIKIFNKDEEKYVDKVVSHIQGGKIQHAHKWDDMLNNYKKYLESMNEQLEDFKLVNDDDKKV